MSNILGQVQSAATTTLNTTVNLVNQAAASVSQAANSETAKNIQAQAGTIASNVGTQASNLASNVGTQASNMATNVGTQATALAGQAHKQAHAIAPTIVPAPAVAAIETGGTVDESGDLSPTNEKDVQKMDKLFAQRASANELQEKGILKGEPGDALAGKKAALEGAMMKDKLNEGLAQRPTAEELVKKGILTSEDQV